MKIMNRQELRKLDMLVPHAFEISKLENNKCVCIAYITAIEQWRRFVSQYEGDRVWVADVDCDNNIAMLYVE